MVPLEYDPVDSSFTDNNIAKMRNLISHGGQLMIVDTCKLY